MNHQKTPRLKPLLEKVPPGFIVDTAWLRRQDIDPKSIYDYAQRGWLEKVIRGVYRRPQPSQGAQASGDWQMPLLSIQWLMGYDVHLGGPSALGLHGYAHYLPLGGEERIYLFGRVPSWLTRLPVAAQFVVRSRSLFDDDPVGMDNADHGIDAAAGPGPRGVGSTVH